MIYPKKQVSLCNKSQHFAYIIYRAKTSFFLKRQVVRNSKDSKRKKICLKWLTVCFEVAQLGWYWLWNVLVGLPGRFYRGTELLSLLGCRQGGALVEQPRTRVGQLITQLMALWCHRVHQWRVTEKGRGGVDEGLGVVEERLGVVEEGLGVVDVVAGVTRKDQLTRKCWCARITKMKKKYIVVVKKLFFFSEPEMCEAESKTKQ